MTLRVFSSKCSFHICICSLLAPFCSWGALPLAHFINCLPCYSWLSVFYWISYFIILTSNVFLFVLVCVSYSLCAFLSFYALAFVAFLFLHEDAVFMLFCFLLTASVSHGILFGSWFGWYACCCCCFPVGIDKVSIFFIWGMCFRQLLKSIKFVSYSYHIFIANISIGKWGPVVACGFWLFLCRFRCIFDVTILWSKDSP